METFAVKVCSVHAQRMKCVLEECGLLDNRRKLQRIAQDQVLIPVTEDIKLRLSTFILATEGGKVDGMNNCELKGDICEHMSCDVSPDKQNARLLNVDKAIESGDLTSENKIVVDNIQKEGQSQHSSQGLRTLSRTGNSEKVLTSDQVSSLVDCSFILKGMEGALVTSTSLPPSKKAKIKTPYMRMKAALKDLAKEHGTSWTLHLERDIPRHWEAHGDLVLFPEGSFRMPEWRSMAEKRWAVVADALGCRRLARKSRIQPDDFRSPRVDLLLGGDSWVEHVDNHIRYCYDITHSMFSAGNISEKIRIGSFICQGETVVDLFAGIGYFVLPYLVHAGAKFVHACEWNPHAVKALKQNLQLNNVQDRCQVHFGDNREVCPKSVADRVNLGLIPSSEGSWSVACSALKLTGGVLHIHGNVETFLSKSGRQEGSLPDGVDVDHFNHSNQIHSSSSEVTTATTERDTDLLDCKETKSIKWMPWVRHIESKIKQSLEGVHEGQWDVKVYHIEHVKSYAPHMDHLVADVSCRPKAQLEQQHRT